jgi:hypothetical protein
VAVGGSFKSAVTSTFDAVLPDSTAFASMMSD